MEITPYNQKKIEISYNLTKNHKYFRKARAIILKDNKLQVIKVSYNDSGKIEYLVPGGGVDEGEECRNAVKREAQEEYSMIVNVVSLIGRQYYRVKMKYKEEGFYSNRVEFYYLCQYLRNCEIEEFGEKGEFESKEKKYEKTELTLEQVLKIKPKDINNMNQKIYDNLVKIMKGN